MVEKGDARVTNIWFEKAGSPDIPNEPDIVELSRLRNMFVSVKGEVKGNIALGYFINDKFIEAKTATIESAGHSETPYFAWPKSFKRPGNYDVKIKVGQPVGEEKYNWERVFEFNVEVV
ncbi:hypothetical protein F1737_08690 [Methanoplanus sp. FWC-SCC4]|uniref:Uncharacterized protein n=1 Tax=Methanochimaera problematica TaxID=2609417 RepID=A0AA97FCY1_9EURY|nr:hypothetical protein [Methanoplanus sp. FWC-SCC4]WOF16762.1 hypothetical protein F1737_08690 [Methanoplanus sp. FWC-SCC4]